MKALVLWSGKQKVKRVAEEVLVGAQLTKAQAFFAEAPVSIEGFDLVFLGFQKFDPKKFDGDWTGKKFAVFCVHGKKDAVLKATDFIESRGGKFVNSLGLYAYGLLSILKKLSEQDLIRARGFGERTTNNALHVKIQKHSKKRHIRGYLK